MGFKTGDFPPVDPETYLDRPFSNGPDIAATHWVEYGFGTPKMVHAIYIVKLLCFYLLGGVLVATLTSDVGPFSEVADWWIEPIIYQKIVLWTVLLETIGVAGSWGPLAGNLKPMTGGIQFWFRRARSASHPGLTRCRSPRATRAPRSTSCCTWGCWRR